MSEIFALEAMLAHVLLSAELSFLFKVVIPKAKQSTIHKLALAFGITTLNQFWSSTDRFKPRSQNIYVFF